MKNKKVLMIVLDGLGDRTYKELKGMTPCEYANTPNLDELTSKSICGLMYSVGRFVRPSSDVAHMAMFGLDYEKCYTGRGPIELAGLGIKLKEGELAFRGNFAQVDSSDVIIDRRANRFTPSSGLLQKISKIYIDDVLFEVTHIAEHRFALKVTGVGLSSAVTDSDPHYEGVKPYKIQSKDNLTDSLYTANICNRYINIVRNILRNDKDIEANNVLLRSCGGFVKWDGFEDLYGMSSACITNNALYNGIGVLLGMNVVLSNRYNDFHDYYKNFQRLVLNSLEKYDFVFAHIQEADLLGEDGNLKGKIEIIEKIDNVLSFVNKLSEDVLLLVTADHSTPCCMKAHSGDSVPILFCGTGLRTDDVLLFGERYFCKGGLGTIVGKDLMPAVMNFIGKSKLIGG